MIGGLGGYMVTSGLVGVCIYTIYHDYEEECEDECVPRCPCEEPERSRKIIVRHVKEKRSKCCQPRYECDCAPRQPDCGCVTPAPMPCPTPTPVPCPTPTPAPCNISVVTPNGVTQAPVTYVDAATAAAEGLVLAPVQFAAPGATSA